MQIDNLKNPTLFLYQLMGYLDRTNLYKYSPAAKLKMKTLFCSAFSYVARNSTNEEEDRCRIVLRMTDF